MPVACRKSSFFMPHFFTMNFRVRSWLPTRSWTQCSGLSITLCTILDLWVFFTGLFFIFSKPFDVELQFGSFFPKIFVTIVWVLMTNMVIVFYYCIIPELYANATRFSFLFNTILGNWLAANTYFHYYMGWRTNPGIAPTVRLISAREFEIITSVDVEGADWKRRVDLQKVLEWQTAEDPSLLNMQQMRAQNGPSLWVSLFRLVINIVLTERLVPTGHVIPIMKALGSTTASATTTIDTSTCSACSWRSTASTYPPSASTTFNRTSTRTAWVIFGFRLHNKVWTFPVEEHQNLWTAHPSAHTGNRKWWSKHSVS